MKVVDSDRICPRSSAIRREGTMAYVDEIEPGKVAIVRNGDYSAPRLVISKDAKDKYNQCRVTGLNSDRIEVQLELDWLLEYVGAYMRQEAISALEQASGKTVLKDVIEGLYKFSSEEG